MVASRLLPPCGVVVARICAPCARASASGYLGGSAARNQQRSASINNEPPRHAGWPPTRPRAKLTGKYRRPADVHPVAWRENPVPPMRRSPGPPLVFSLLFTSGLCVTSLGPTTYGLLSPPSASVGDPARPAAFSATFEPAWRAVHMLLASSSALWQFQ
jgi:hypothetical protein